MKKPIVTLYIRSEGQLSDILTKTLARASFQRLPFKLSMFDLSKLDIVY